ncbi:hypothetical protein PV416_49200, partial [Streptomyces ipomoeae]|uniref:hypothetical protein n=1 Tax=Streptomyces ipomoeae TaxID=103232 RepID=UPI0029BC7754
MLPPELPPLPALTRAEAELIDRYLDVVDLLGRINPARPGDTYRGLRAAQALVGKATALRNALELMHRRGGCLYVLRQGIPVGFGVIGACWGHAASATSGG